MRASRQILNGNTAETILAASCSTRIAHSSAWYVGLRPTIFRMYRINDARASPVLIVTSGIWMAMYLSTRDTCSKGIFVRSLPKPWLADLPRNAVAAVVAPCLVS